MIPEYEVFAIRYATREARRHQHFIGGDPHDGPLPMDYFVWVAKNAERSVVIDIGFTAESGGQRGRTRRRRSISYQGHDPEVMRRYPLPRPELEGIVVPLDVTPTF